MRDDKLGKKAKTELEARQDTADALRDDATIIGIAHLDLSSFSSVRNFVEGLRDEKLDVVMLNAGMVIWEWTLTDDGYEKALQVNYLSTALLAHLILPIILRNKDESSTPGILTPPRLIFTSSDAHYNAPLSYAQILGFNAASSGNKPFQKPNTVQGQPIVSYLTDPDNYDAYTRYLDTKLLLLLFARQLAAKTPSSSCIISSVHPGFIATRLFRDASVMNWLTGFWPIKRLISRIPEQGAVGMINAAIVKGEESHGRYMSESKIRDESTFVRSAEGMRMQEQLWKETLEILELTDKLDLSASCM